MLFDYFEAFGSISLMVLECLVIEHFGVVSSVVVIIQGLRFLGDWLAFLCHLTHRRFEVPLSISSRVLLITNATDDLSIFAIQLVMRIPLRIVCVKVCFTTLR